MLGNDKHNTEMEFIDLDRCPYVQRYFALCSSITNTYSSGTMAIHFDGEFGSRKLSFDGRSVIRDVADQSFKELAWTHLSIAEHWFQRGIVVFSSANLWMGNGGPEKKNYSIVALCTMSFGLMRQNADADGLLTVKCYRYCVAGCTGLMVPVDS